MDVPRIGAEDAGGVTLESMVGLEFGVDWSEATSAASRAARQLARFARGDVAAFEELVADYHQAACTVARRILGDEDQAHDVTQESFMRILRHHERYDVHRPFHAWFMHIVRNVALDRLRRRQRLESVSADRLSSFPAPETSNAAGIEDGELRQQVGEVLATLPEKYREVMVMRDMEGMPAESIATHTGIDYSTTRWRLFQARRLFRDAWVQRFGAQS